MKNTRLASTGYPVDAGAEKERFDDVSAPLALSTDATWISEKNERRAKHLQYRTRHLINEECTDTYCGLALYAEQ